MAEVRGRPRRKKAPASATAEAPTPPPPKPSKKTPWKDRPWGDLSERQKESWSRLRTKYLGAAQALNGFFCDEPTFSTAVVATHTFSQIEEAVEALRQFCAESSITHKVVDDTIHTLEHLRSILPKG